MISSTSLAKRLLPLGFFAALLAAGCTESALNPTTALEPRRSDAVQVTATGICADDKAAIDAGINALDPNETLRLVGNFKICSPIDINKSNIRITGGGTALVRQMTIGQHVFSAIGSTSTFLTNITIDSLNFRGEEYEQAGVEEAFRVEAMALFARHVNGITFRHNNVTYLGLFESDHNSGKPYTQYGKPEQSSNIVITDNTGIGRSSHFPYISGVIIGYARDAVVARNQLSNYWHGIMWWGGKADPISGDGEPQNPRHARNIRIETNNVSVVEGGIWGSMGDSITITQWNHVETCYDLCLDAEGSNNVVFEQATAKFARFAVLAVFDHSKNIIFRDIAVEQDGRRIDGAVWNGMFRTSGPTTGKGVSIDLHNNRMVYTGNGVGMVTKGPSENFRFNANRLTNTVIGLSADRNGAISIENNLLELDRQTRFYDGGTDSIVPAIRVAHNYLENGDPMELISIPYELTIVGNRILSPSVQTKPGIMVEEPNHPDVDALISLNSVQGFPKSLSLSWGSDGQKTFDVVDNGATTSNVLVNGEATTISAQPQPWSGTSSGNFLIDPQPNVVSYTVHGPTYMDWQPPRYGFETAGTTGQSRDINQLRVNNIKLLSNAKICLRAHIEGVWVPALMADAPCSWEVSAGTFGGGRIQAVQMWLKDAVSGANICYQTHVGNVGWQSEQCNGATAGVVAPNTNAVQAIRISVTGI